LYEIVRGYPGNCSLQILLSLSDGNQARLTAGKLRVNVDAQMRERIDDLLGPAHFRLLTSRPSASPPAHVNGRRAAALSGSA
ncbi:MAG TPA: hypothetical protein VGH32_05900, partial [Pirellulales bacterium]